MALYAAVDKRRVAIAIALLKAGAKVNSSVRQRVKNILNKAGFKAKNADRLDELRTLLAQAQNF